VNPSRFAAARDAREPGEILEIGMKRLDRFDTGRLRRERQSERTRQ